MGPTSGTCCVAGSVEMPLTMSDTYSLVPRKSHEYLLDAQAAQGQQTSARLLRHLHHGGHGLRRGFGQADARLAS